MRTAATKRESRILPIRIDSLKIPRAGVAQREFSQAHGDAIAAAFDMGKFGYPVVNQVDGTDWVIDGQHRVYALRKQPASTSTDRATWSAEAAHDRGRAAATNWPETSTYDAECMESVRRETAAVRQDTAALDEATAVAVIAGARHRYARAALVDRTAVLRETKARRGRCDPNGGERASTRTVS